MNVKIIFACFFYLLCFNLYSQNKEPKGNLFIIGGGDRSPELIKELIETAKLKSKDHIAILPMSGGEPDTSFYYIKMDLEIIARTIWIVISKQGT